MTRPAPEEYDAFYSHYIALAAGQRATALPLHYGSAIASFFNSLPENKATYTYATGKWTLRQVLQHLIDVERVFIYRLLWIVRGDPQSLPGFDENSFAEKATVAHRSLQDLTEEWLSLRSSSDRFVASLTAAELGQQGTANGSKISANALCFIIYGHVLHHMQVIKDRYLP